MTVLNKVKEKYKIKDVLINHIGPVIGSHSGPDTIAIFFYR
ncbi:MAG: DegV family protein [Eubacteriales bacterium]